MSRSSTALATVHRFGPASVAIAARLMGLLLLTDALWSDAFARINDQHLNVPSAEGAAARAVCVAGGLLLLRVGAGLRRRKRREWGIAVGITLIVTIASAIRDQRSYTELVVLSVFLIVLLVSVGEFRARPDPRSRWVALRVLVQFAIVGFIYGFVLLLAYPHNVIGHPSLARRALAVLEGFVGTSGAVQFRGDRFGDVFHATLLGFAIVTVVAVVLLLLRPQHPAPALTAADEAQLRELLARHGGRDSLGYFALRNDKSVVWSPTQKAAVTYRVVTGVALASGDPIGDPEAWPGAIKSYRELVEQHGWTPAVLACSELGATTYQREYDLSALALGDEAIVDTAEFSLDGRAMRGVRQACSRVERSGYVASVRRVRDVPPDELDELRRLGEVWRGDAVERGFSMALSRLGDPADDACVIATATQEGRVRALLHFVPWGTDGLSLDLMRRDRDSDNGLNEWLITKLIAACPDLGVKRISLNFAVFREALERGAKIGAGPVLRSWRAVLLVASRWWQIDSLYRFNAKFIPDWEPRLICFPAARDLPRIAVAALEAEAFLVRPHRLSRWLHRP